MVRYIIKRLFQSLLTILLVVSVVFILIRMMPMENFFTDDEQIKLTEAQKYDRLASKGLMEKCSTCGTAGLIYRFTAEGAAEIAALDPDSSALPYNLTAADVKLLQGLTPDADGELTGLSAEAVSLLKKLYKQKNGPLAARTCPTCADQATLAVKSKRPAADDAYATPGPGYVRRSVLAQLGDFYLDLFQVRVYQKKTQLINDDPMTVSEDPDHVFHWGDIITIKVGEKTFQTSSIKKKKNLSEDGTSYTRTENLGGHEVSITIPADDTVEVKASDVVQGDVADMPVQLITTHTDTYEIEKPDVTPVGAIPYLLAKIRGEDPFGGAVDPATGDFARVVFNLGKSLRESKGQYVTDIIQDKMGISLTVGLISLAFSLVLGVIFGVLQAQFKNGIIDHIGTGYTVLVNAVPHLVIYTLIMVLGSKLLQVPMQYDANAGADSWRSMILPVVCLSIGSIAGYMLWTRRYMVDELNKDYIRLARLKGLPEHKVLFRHVLKNAFVPLAQYLPYSILLTVGGSLLVERFFGIPGMGPMLTNSIAKLDLPLVQGIVMLYASLGIIGVFLGDLLMTLIDPRIKLTGKEGVR